LKNFSRKSTTLQKLLKHFKEHLIDRCIEKLTQVAHCRISTASGSERCYHKGLTPAVTLATARGTDLAQVNFSTQCSIKASFYAFSSAASSTVFSTALIVAISVFYPTIVRWK
jgi:hypothetical protein